MGYSPSPHECYLLIRQYDSANRARLSNSDFCQLALPATNNYLRESSKRARGHVDDKIEFEFAKLLSLELELQQKLEEGKKDTTNRYDFNLLAAFKLINANRKMSIDRSSLSAFLEPHGIFMRPEDLDSIFRRLDHDGDEALNYSEFVQALMPSRNFDNSKTSVYRESTRSQLRTASPLRVSITEPSVTPSDTSIGYSATPKTNEL